MNRKANCYNDAFIVLFWKSMKLEIIKRTLSRTCDERAPPCSTTSNHSITANGSTPVLAIAARSPSNLTLYHNHPILVSE